ncbi:MAG TPA: RluA family pseudouridine synthase [Patescibacteria group bacterium]|nr:RluA family pseudouridine synthase [Patescibacteria group bacterium]
MDSQEIIFVMADQPEESIDSRLDIFLTIHLTDMSRSHIQKLIADHQITVNNKSVKANYRLQANDVLRIFLPAAAPVGELTPEDIPLNILYEDSHIVVVNKARGMVVHPAAGNLQGTLVNALLEHCTDLSGISGEIRPGIVHRLDKDTSGAMVVAKNDKSHLHLADQIRARTAGRKYLAIVYGNIIEEKGVINAPIGRHPADRKKMAVTFTNSKEAVTHFRVVERLGQYTVVECKLLTGRTHQIRVHMAYIGHCVVGDPKYGPARHTFTIAGQALHSAELTLTHPVTGEQLTFAAPIPDDFQNLWNQLRQTKK